MTGFSSAIFHMNEWRAMFWQEYSVCEARSFQDKQKSIIGSAAKPT